MHGYVHVQPTVILRVVLSKSTGVWSRKTVNCSSEGPTLGKLWWRQLAMLTSTSFVKLLFGVERALEPSGRSVSVGVVFLVPAGDSF